ncbi:MAG TPA: hypothetical protein VM286_04070 [Candidatus Thermoplasmatota archaeon]|nr:hypothetical protein [Candidatus Thermoplasmatota archaeon]
MRALAGLLLMALLLPGLATAQVPQVPLPGAASISVKATSEPVHVSLEAPATVTVTVANTEAPTNSPLDMPRFVALTVSGTTEGWTASLSEGSFQLRPGESRQAKLQLSVSAGAPEKEVKVTVTAKAYGRGINTIPVAGPQADPEAEERTDVTAQRIDPPQRVLLETVGPYVWMLLVALVAAVVVILSLLAANRRVAVRLSASEPQHLVAPGSRTVFPVLVQNITRREDSIVLRVRDVPEGWATFLPTPQLDLDGGRQEEVPVVIIAPKDAPEGTKQPFTVVATSALAPRRPASVVLEAEVSAPRRKGKEPPARPNAP